MSCDITHGRAEACKDSISGIDAIYFLNFGAFDPDADITYDSTNTSMINSIDATVSLYKYELKGANSFDQPVQTNRDNGTTYFEQTLVAQLKKQDVAMHETFQLLAYGRPHIIVRTRTNQFFMAGLKRGCDMTAGNIGTGSAMGDFNGYNMTFTGMENAPANFLDCSNEDTLIAVFTAATIVVS